MDINGLVRMAMRILMRRGMREMSKKLPQDDRLKQAKQSMRTLRRIRRM